MFSENRLVDEMCEKTQNVLFRSYYKNGYANAQQCYAASSRDGSRNACRCSCKVSVIVVRFD